MSRTVGSYKRKAADLAYVAEVAQANYKRRYGSKAVGTFSATGLRRGRMARAGSELKFFDTALSFNFDATAEVPATGQLTLIPQGVTDSQRVGRKCTVKSIHIEGFVFSAAGVFSDTVAIYVVLDKQTNGAAAAATDVVTAASLASGGLPAALSNLENSDRFVILKKIVVAPATGYGIVGAEGRVNQVPVSYYKRCNVNIEYDSTAATGAITTIRSNNIFLLAGSTGQTDDNISFQGNCRLRFSDN